MHKEITMNTENTVETNENTSAKGATETNVKTKKTKKAPRKARELLVCIIAVHDKSGAEVYSSGASADSRTARINDVLVSSKAPLTGAEIQNKLDAMYTGAETVKALRAHLSHLLRESAVTLKAKKWALNRVKTVSVNGRALGAKTDKGAPTVETETNDATE